MTCSFVCTFETNHQVTNLEAGTDNVACVFAWQGSCGPVDLMITDRTLDLLDDDDLATVAQAMSVGSIATMRQVHGADVARVADSSYSPPADALVTDVRDLGLVVRVADCVPVVLVAPDAGLVSVAHAGRRGLVAGVVPAAVSALRDQGATDIQSWIGPHVCGRCYELPQDMADEVAAAVPAARATTSAGTPGADLGAGVRSQLDALDVDVHDVSACTMEDERFFSHRRGDVGRFGAVAVVR